jgi:hypothetical protein
LSRVRGRFEPLERLERLEPVYGNFAKKVIDK